MAKSRFVLRYGGTGPKPEADVARVSDLSAALVVDSSARMLLVEAEAGSLAALVESLPDWVMTPEQNLPLPDAHQKVERASDEPP